MGNSEVEAALAKLGESVEMRNIVFDELREFEKCSECPAQFRFNVRWPIIRAIIGRDTHRIKLQNGLIFDVRPQSRIEKALLLSLDNIPDHAWEPQTTRLSCLLAKDCDIVIVGGAYIGEQVLSVSKNLQKSNEEGFVCAFEPDPSAYNSLIHHVEINKLPNIIAEQRALWDCSNGDIELKGEPSVASTLTDRGDEEGEILKVRTVSIVDYIRKKEISGVGLIMMDIEGAEKQALFGCKSLLKQKYPKAPNIIFEVHSEYVDWSKGLKHTDIVQMLLSFGYSVYAIRDLQGHLSMEDRAIEIIPLDHVYLAEVPHGFNMIATKDKELAVKYDLTIVKDLSPKLLSEKNVYLPYPPKDFSLHLPCDGLGLQLF